MKYRTRQIEVTAEQFNGTNFPDKAIPTFYRGCPYHDGETGDIPRHANISRPDRGFEILCPGDWWVTEPDGTRFAVKPEEFAARYEPVEAEEDPGTEYDGLSQKKFTVKRLDGEDTPGGRHEHDRYFVLNLSSDRAARVAAAAYAAACEPRRPRLCRDLRNLLKELHRDRPL